MKAERAPADIVITLTQEEANLINQALFHAHSDWVADWHQGTDDEIGAIADGCYDLFCALDEVTP